MLIHAVRTSKIMEAMMVPFVACGLTGVAALEHTHNRGGKERGTSDSSSNLVKPGGESRRSPLPFNQRHLL